MANILEMNEKHLSPPTSFDVSIYGDDVSVSATKSQKRLRIFYKGLNRNRTFISDEFANQLIESLPYTPVKGIFNKDSVDYEDHGADNCEGKIYGIVPENPNFAWEKHLDVDGVEREYACCDVYLFTSLYPEAKLIQGKSQSMEIYRKTMKGEWRDDIDGKPYYHFLKGEFIGLQVLGDEVEPCFEGAAFFSLLETFNNKLAEIENIQKQEGNKIMDKALFNLSGHEKAEALFDLINPNFTEEKNWEINGLIYEMNDEYAYVIGKTQNFSKVHYTVKDDVVSIEETAPLKVMTMAESEFSALNELKTIDDSYEAVLAKYNSLVKDSQNYQAEKDSLNEKISDLENQIASMSKKDEPKEETEEKADSTEFIEKMSQLTDENIELKSQLKDFENRVNELTDFKNNIELQKKEDILTKYQEFLSDDVVEDFKNRIGDFSVIDFKKEICTKVLDSQSDTLFSNKEKAPAMYHKADNSADKTAVFGAAALIQKHRNGGND